MTNIVMNLKQMYMLEYVNDKINLTSSTIIHIYQYEQQL